MIINWIDFSQVKSVIEPMIFSSLSVIISTDPYFDRFSTHRGFFSMIKEVNDLAGQHEGISENLLNVVLQDLQASTQETKQERKRVTKLTLFFLHLPLLFTCSFIYSSKTIMLQGIINDLADQEMACFNFDSG